MDEAAKFAINAEKWANAHVACIKNNMSFEVWTENELKKMGILNWEVDKAVALAERRAMPKSKYNRKNPKVGPPKRRS